MTILEDFNRYQISAKIKQFELIGPNLSILLRELSMTTSTKSIGVYDTEVVFLLARQQL